MTTAKIMKSSMLLFLLTVLSVCYYNQKASAQDCLDFVTGGGSFAPRLAGGPPAEVNYGFNANGELRGHFNLVDQNDGTRIQSVNVGDYELCAAGDLKCRFFRGEATINKVPGYRYEVGVCDYGDPGRDDRIRVIVTDGAGAEVYRADNEDSGKACPAGATFCGDLDGGDIQLHQGCPTCP